MIRRILFALTLMSIALVGQSQDPVQSDLKFDVFSHDFGVLTEGDEAIYAFEFTYTGKDTLRLKSEDIRPGCGCTSKDYTKEPILSGGRGKIIASFNTVGRVGTFNKSIAVMQNNQTVGILYIKGIVLAKAAPDTLTTEKQLKASSNVTVDRSAYNFGKVEKGQKVLTSFTVKNSGKDTLKFNSVQAACSCINYKLFKEKSTETVEYILPGKSATMEITYYPSGVGKARDIFTIFSNSKVTPRLSVTLEADVVESLQQKSIIMDGGGDQAPFGK